MFYRTRREVEFSKQPTFWKIMWEQITGNVAISEVGSLMYVGQSKAEKHVPCGELVVTTESLTL
jgi:hypothetical protein